MNLCVDCGPVSKVKHGEAIRQGMVYVIPSGTAFRTTIHMSFSRTITARLSRQRSAWCLPDAEALLQFLSLS